MGLENIDVHSVDCENLDIRAWAKQIREIKTREFEDYIETVKKHFGINELNMHPLIYVRHKNRIAELERKLETLKNNKNLK